LLTVVTLLAVLGTLALGRWQLSRAAQKEAIQSSIDQRAALSPLTGAALAGLMNPVSELHRGVILRGLWLPEHTVFLDNRPMNGKAGLFVVTPLRLEGSDAVILVQRGWVARNFIDRMQVPEIATPEGLVEIQGRIAPPPAKLYEFAGPESGRIRQNLDLSAFAIESGWPLRPVSIQQLGVAGDGLLRQWPQVATGVDKHHGYAFQWFALSGLIFILYVWFQIVRRFIIPRRA
jgi:surfeit locus 1 family protein